MKRKADYLPYVTIIAVVAIVAVVLLVLNGNKLSSVGEVSRFVNARQINANSCDADSICEVAKTVSTKIGSTSALILTSDVKEVIVDGSLAAGSVFINGKTVSTNPKSTSALILTSDVKEVIVDGSLAATKLVGTGNAYICVDSEGYLYRSLTACI